MIDPLWKKKKKFTTIAAKYFHCVNNKIEPCVSLSSREKFSFNNATGHGYIQFQLQYCPFHPSISLLLSRAHRLAVASFFVILIHNIHHYWPTIVNITIFIFINRSNNRYYFRQWGDVHSSKHRVTNSHYLFETGSFFIYVVHIRTRAHIYAYSEAARGVIPPHEKENRRIGGTNVCLPIGTMVVAGSKVENFFHVHMKGVSISSESKFLEILTRACWRWAAFQTVLLPCTG